MAEFSVEVVQVDDVTDHPNADRLTVVTIGGYKCIANKNEDGSWRYKKGDLVVYIPEQSIIPEWLLKKMNLWNEEKNIGMLAGKAGNRVKAIKLRGIISQGLLYPVISKDITFVGRSISPSSNTCHIIETNDGVHNMAGVKLGDNVAELLGIEKYVPEIPMGMDGDVIALYGKTIKYDIENYQKYNTVLQEGERVVFTEKLHGTFTGLVYWPKLNHPELFFGGDYYAFSKGFGAAGLVFSNCERNERNIYVNVLKEVMTEERREKIIAWQEENNYTSQPIFIFGETFGRGIQDLHYGQDKPTFRGFDVFIGDPSTGRYLNPDEMISFLNYIGVVTVPILYQGPWSEEIAVEFRDGKDMISGSNVREGIVIKPCKERRDDFLGRVVLKYVSPDYLLRKGNVTEYN